MPTPVHYGVELVALAMFTRFGHLHQTSFANSCGDNSIAVSGRLHVEEQKKKKIQEIQNKILFVICLVLHQNTTFPQTANVIVF